MPNITPNQLRLLEHTMGYPQLHRNHYIADADHFAWNDLLDLVEKGYIKNFGPNEVYGNQSFFRATDKAKKLIAECHGLAFKKPRRVGLSPPLRSSIGDQK